MNVTARNKRTGEVQFAVDAYRCREDGHECPRCAAEVEIRCSRCGNHYTKLFPHRSHAPGCIGTEWENSKRIIDPDEIDTDDLFDHVLSPRQKRPKRKTGRHRGPRKKRERKTGITDLTDVYYLGLHDQPDQVINDKVMLKDLVVNHCTVHDVDIGDCDLGRRIIYAKPIGYKGPPYRTLTFGLFWAEGDDLMMSVFEMELTSDREYWDMFKRLFEQDPAAGTRRQKYRSKYKRVLICGIWTAKPIMTSNGNWRCVSYQQAVCPLPGQQICTNNIDLIK